MKKIVIAFLMLFIILSIIGCKKKNVDDDVYGSGNDGKVIVEEGIKEPVEEPIIEEPVIEEPVIEEVVEETPVEDVYEAASVPIDFDFKTLYGLEPVLVEDEILKEELQEYLKTFYFNYYFSQNVDTESGDIEIDAMTLFAVSYIMQHENEELKFDYESYKLYIPKEHVINVVQKYFHRQLDVFNTYETYDIGYEDDLYSVVVEDGKWDVDLSIASIEKLGDFTYKVVGELTSRTSGRVKERIEAIIDESHDGQHILINYIVLDIEE